DGAKGTNPRPDAKDTWEEKLVWGWKFKGDDRWLHVDITKGKYFKSGDLRFLPDKSKYQLVMTTVDDKPQTYEGTLKDDILMVENSDPDTKKVTRLVMNNAAEGARFIYRLDNKKGTLYAKEYQVNCSKDGESMAAGKKNVCCVTGGAGTIAVTFEG